MKSVLNLQPPQPEKPKYPYLGVSEEHKVVVFFVAKRTGVCLDSGSDTTTTPGYSSGYWDEDRYAPLKGSITLSND